MSDVTVVPTTQAVSAAEQPAAVRAFEETTGIRSKIEPDDNEHMNVDPAAASMTVLGALPAIALLEKEIADEFKKFDPIMLVQAKTYALAAIYAHSRHRFVSVPVPITPERVEKATKKRNLMVSTYRMAAEHGLVSAEPLGDLSNPNGHKNVPVDLLGVANLMLENWGALEGKVPLTRADVLSAINEATELAEALGLRDHGLKDIEVSLLDKKRAFTLMSRLYKDLRGMVGWVRRHDGDAEQITPSFHYRSSPRGKSAPEVAAPPSPTPDAPTASDPLPGVSAPIGHPDASPFQRN